MSVSIPQIRVGQELLVEPLEESLLRPIAVRVSSVSDTAIIVTLDKRRDLPALAVGQRLRISTADSSGAWVFRASVTTPLIRGRTWFTIQIEEVEEHVQRRLQPRSRLQMPLRIQPEGSQGELIARSENLSLGGVCFETAFALAEETRVTITLSLDTGQSLSVRGVVVWCTDSSRSPGRFVAGVRLAELPPLPLLALKRFLRDKGTDLGRS